MSEVKQQNPYQIEIVDACEASWQSRIDQGIPAAFTENGTVLITDILFSQYDGGYLHITIGSMDPEEKNINYQIPLLDGECVILQEDVGE